MKISDMPEPPDGTRLVAIDEQATPYVIWRDDAYAKNESGVQYDDQRWFGTADGPDWDFPDNWRDTVRRAVFIYAIPVIPIAVR